MSCFEYCKTLLSNEYSLVHPDFEKSFEFTTNASNYAIGVVLSQEGHLIVYTWRTIKPVETNYTTIEK